MATIKFLFRDFFNWMPSNIPKQRTNLSKKCFNRHPPSCWLVVDQWEGPGQCDLIGHFLKFLVTIFFKKSCPNFLWPLGRPKNKQKRIWLTLWQLLEKWVTFYSIIWSHWPTPIIWLLTFNTTHWWLLQRRTDLPSAMFVASYSSF